jgi:cytochrome c oxidase subunit II
MSLRAPLLALLCAVLCAPVQALADTEEFGYCTTCHGAQGNGNPAIGAPKIAGLEPWYLKRQLEAFRAGWRGVHPDDTTAREMRFVAQAIPDAAALDRAVAYVGTLAAEPAARTLAGDAQRGAVHYAACAACHGARGEGNAALDAPRLAGQSDWYVAAQLDAYRAGRRGAHAQDGVGARMRPLAALVPDASAVADLLAHLDSLARAETKEAP